MTRNLENGSPHIIDKDSSALLKKDASNISLVRSAIVLVNSCSILCRLLFYDSLIG